MRIHIVDIDASPEEVARSPELRDLLRALGRAGSGLAPSANSTTTATTPDSTTTANQPMGPESVGLPQQLVAMLDARGPGGIQRRALDAFLTQVLAWEGVEPRVGVSRLDKQAQAKGLRLHRRGSGVGAFVYVNVSNGNLQFRLSRNYDLSAMNYAHARDVQPSAPYGVTMRITLPGLSEAVALASASYEASVSRGTEVPPVAGS